MDEQTETPTEAKRLSFWSFIAWPAIVLVVYVLSVGPLVVMDEKGLLKGKTGELLGRIYAPLMWIYEETPLHKPLKWYVNLWTGRFEHKRKAK
jgi:hypothetical protein